MRKKAKQIAAMLLIAVGVWALPLETFVWSAEGDAPADAPGVEEASPDARADEQPAEAPAETPQGSFTSVPASSDEVPADQRVQASAMGLDERVSLDLRNIEAADALRFLAQKGGLNLAISKNVAGRVQLLLNNVPIRDILDIIL